MPEQKLQEAQNAVETTIEEQPFPLQENETASQTSSASEPVSEQTSPTEETSSASELVSEQASPTEEASSASEQADHTEEAPKQPEHANNTPLYKKIFRVFNTHKGKAVFIISIMCLSAYLMFLMDDYNYIRSKFFPWLENNSFNQLLKALNVGRTLVEGSWLLLLTLFFIIITFIATSVFRKKIVSKAAEKNADSFKTQLGAKRFYSFIFYLVLILSIAAVIFILYMMGVYDHLWTPTEPGVPVPPIEDVIANLLYLILLSAIFILLIPFLLFCTAYFIHYLFAIIKRIKQAIQQHKQQKTNMNDNPSRNNFNANNPVLVKMNEPIVIREEPVPPHVLGKEIFPSLVRIDDTYNQRETVEHNAEMSLEEFCLQFQAYAISRKIYYELPMLRSFLAGLSAARLIILEGLSGTGKSMLPRMFCEFTNSKSFFAPVQATWRDKSDMLGYFSEFTKSFKSTDFLKNLYEASYTDRVNLMVLDEMNISRIEYYFADFLSILEYPPEDWKVRVFEPVLGQELPEKLPDGYVSIPENTWFIGTANTDDSTFTITDKVYDRAIVLDFAEKFSPITSNYIADPIHIDYETLKKMFTQAQGDSTKRLNKTDEEKFTKICDFVAEGFDVRFGNRIMVQINNFVPVYVALGGTKEEALDFMFARKVMRKLNGAFEDDVKDKLITLLKLLAVTYGKGTFKETEKTVNKILKRLV